MLNRAVRLCRTHPILVAALLGAIAGSVNVIVIEVSALAHRSTGGVLPFIFSSGAVTSRIGQAGALQASLLLLMEVAGNLLGLMLLFVVPVALLLAVKRLTQRRKSDALSNSTES